MNKNSNSLTRKVLFFCQLAIGITAVFVLVNKNQYSFPSSVISGYVSKPDHSPGDTATVILNVKTNLKRQVVHLFDINNKAVDSIIATPDENKITLKYLIPENLNGIYYFENKVPLIVNVPNSQLAVVYPFLNEQAHSNNGGASFYNYNSDDGNAALHLSLHRPIIAYHQYRKFLTFIDSSFNPEVITEARLEKSITPKLILFIGNFPFLTEKMKSKLMSHLSAGNHIIVLGAYAGKEIIEYDPIRFEMKRTSKTFNLVPFLYMDIGLQGKDTSVTFHLNANTELNPKNYSDSITIKTDFIKGSPHLSNCSMPGIIQDSLKLLACAQFKGSKGESGIIRFSHPSGGNLYYFATNGWATNNNFFQKNENLMKGLIQSLIGKDKQATR